MKQTIPWPILIIALLIAGTSSAAMAECRSNDDAALANCLALDMWTTAEARGQVLQDKKAQGQVLQDNIRNKK